MPTRRLDVYLYWFFIPIDWLIFKEAVLGMWSGQNPYLVGVEHLRVYNPAWTLLFLSPMAFIPAPWDYVSIWVVAMIALAAIAWRLKLSRWRTMALLTSPFLFQSLIIGNIDWLPWVGLLVPNPAVALLFLVIKPQMTMGSMFVLIYRECAPFLELRDWRGAAWTAARLLTPLMGLLAAQVALYGIVVPSPVTYANWSLFPWSIPLGLGALWWAAKRRDVRLGALAGPFLTPYLTPGSYLATAIALPGLSWVAGWVLFAIRAIW